MKTSRLFFAALLSLAAAVPLAAGKPMTFDDLIAARRVGAPQPQPQGQWIAYDVSTMDMEANVRKSAVYIIPAKGGTPVQISDGVKQDEGPVWSPDGKTIAYVSNRDSAAKQVWLYDLESRSSKKVGDLPGGASSLKWLPNGTGLLLVSDVYPECGADAKCHRDKDEVLAQNKRKGRVIEGLLYRHWTSWQGETRSHILLLSLDGTARDLTPGPFNSPHFSVGGGSEFDISPDGGELVYATNVDKQAAISTNSDLYVVPLSGGEARRVTTSPGADTDPHYSPDGKWIAFRSQQRAAVESDLWQLMIYNRANGHLVKVAPLFPTWVVSMAWVPDSSAIAFVSEVQGRDAIYEVLAPNGTPRLLYAEGAASALAVSADGKSIYFDRSTHKRPNEIFAIARDGKRPATSRQVTHENDALFAKIDTGEVTEMKYEGAEGAKIQAWLVKPPNFDPSKKYPAILLAHGGPQGAWNDQWSYRWNGVMFASRGYVVLMPNPRGSTGFGQPFVEDVSGDWGGRAYVDLMKGADELAKLPYVDGNRMGAAGASYGGYMINWILGHTDRFKALVSHSGVYNLESMYGATEELWFPEYEFRGTPWSNPELYEKWSPHKYAKNFKTPTLVSHGELDFRVPVTESMQLFTALQRQGVPSKFMYFPDEGHWVLKPQNAQLWWTTVLDWFDQWLKK